MSATRPQVTLGEIYDNSLQLLPGNYYLMTQHCGDAYVAWWPLVDKVYEPMQRGYGDFGWDTGTRFHARATLAVCIFDAVECGHISHQHGEFDVVLPDGTLFAYLDECGPLSSEISAPK